MRAWPWIGSTEAGRRSGQRRAIVVDSGGGDGDGDGDGDGAETKHEITPIRADPENGLLAVYLARSSPKQNMDRG